MSERRPNIVINFLVRMVVGIAVILFVNEFLAARDISLHVGLNPLTMAASGIFGAPGVALLYGMAFYMGL